MMELVDVILRRELLVDPDLSGTQPDLMRCVAIPLSEGLVIGNLNQDRKLCRLLPTNGVYTFSSTL